MYVNSYEAQMMTEERVKDALREAEQERLFRAARVSNKERKWRLPVLRRSFSSHGRSGCVGSRAAPGGGGPLHTSAVDSGLRAARVTNGN